MFYLTYDAVVILDVFSKKTEKTPDSVIKACQRRLVAFRTLSRTRKDPGHARR